MTERNVEDALVDFTVEAIDEASEILRAGDSQTKLALIKMVLSGALKQKDAEAEGHIEDLKREAREVLAASLEVDEE